MGCAQSGDGAVDVRPLPFEMIDLRDDLLRLQLTFEVVRSILGAKQLVYLGQCEAQLFTSHNHLHTQSINGRV